MYSFELNTETVLFVVYVFINILAFALYGLDKKRAIQDKWRIKESTLLAVSLPGAFGAIIGMKVFRHKTMKLKFKLIYLFLILNIAVLILFFTDKISI